MLKEQNETTTEGKTYNILYHNTQDNKTILLCYTISLDSMLHYRFFF